MAHELDFKADGTARMFSGEGITPWHGFGHVIDGLATAEEALELAGLDYEVKLMPNFFQDEDGNFIQIPDRFSTVRMTDMKPLGTDLSKGYKVFQNEEAFRFLNNLTGTEGQAVITTAGALFGGARTFITLKIGDAFKVGDQDAHDLYAMVTNSHDGTAAFTVSITPIRAVCNNTVTLGLRAAKSKWTLRHKTDLAGQIQEAREILEMSFNYEDAFQKEVEALMDIEVTKDAFFKIVDKIVPSSPRQHDLTVEEIMNVWENEPTVEMGGGEGNAWGAFNALTFWTDHKEYRTPESRFNSIIGTGTGQGLAESLRPKMHKALLALA